MQGARRGGSGSRIGFLICLMFLSTACTHAHTTYLSDHWIEQPQGLYQTSINHNRPILQVIVTYDGLLSSHAALRLIAEHGKVTFWDPAGAYGLRSTDSNEPGNSNGLKITRVKDLVLSRIPDIPTYVQFRWGVGDVRVEVFEWDLVHQDARLFEDVLHNGTEGVGDSLPFQTETTPAFCTVAISEFLKRFAGSYMNLADWHLWPHSLAQALLDQKPTRIRVFHKDAGEVIYISPHLSAGKPHSLTEFALQ